MTTNETKQEMTNNEVVIENKPKVVREYKDRLFKFLFAREERKENALSLYNALNGTNYTNIDDLTITTLEDVVYINMKNDVSFLLKNEMNLYEQQSTWNPNMPLRGLIYFGKLYAAYAKRIDSDIYGRIPVPLPTPRCVVLYNGKEDHGEQTELYLSDHYTGEGDVEVIAHVIDINYERGKKILEKCRVLEEYSLFVSKMRTFVKQGYDMSEAADQAIDECINENILKEIFTQHKAEVKDMIFTEFDQERYDRHRRNEGIGEGIEIGDKERQIKVAKMMKDGGEPLEKIVKYTELTKEEVEEL